MNPTDQAIRENKARYAALCKEQDMSIAHALGRKSLKPETSVSDSVKTLLQFLSE
jgi:hypothetical protein